MPIAIPIFQRRIHPPTFTVEILISKKAYTEYAAAATDIEKQETGKGHIRSVTSHIDELGDKKYQKYIQKAADHVMMFIPNECAYYAATRVRMNFCR